MQRHRRTDRQTDRQTTCDRKTALCTIVHRAVIKKKEINASRICYSNTTVYYGIHERSEYIPVDSGVTNLIQDRRSCADLMLEVEANVARCVHSSVNKTGVKRNSGL